MDCVGPLPGSKAGNEYLLTIMCQVTRYSAAYPLRSVTSKLVVKALTQFISVFGIPKIVQSDQGSNFTSNLFDQVLKQLHIQLLQCLSSSESGSTGEVSSTVKVFTEVILYSDGERMGGWFTLVIDGSSGSCTGKYWVQSK